MICCKMYTNRLSWIPEIINSLKCMITKPSPTSLCVNVMTTLLPSATGVTSTSQSESSVERH